MPPLDPSFEATVGQDVTSDHVHRKLPTKESVPSILEIKKKIPGKYFIPSLWQSLQFVGWDLAVVSLMFSAYLLSDTSDVLHPLVKDLVILPLYTFFQGTMFWAIFVLGHDCGHGSFSRYPWVNEIVGTFLHTLILVPYVAWKLSHRHHHKNTANIDKDEVFHPVRKSEVGKLVGGDKDRTQSIPHFALGFGWLIYLLIGYGPRSTSHVNPFDPLFANERVGVITSLLCVLGQLCGLFYASSIYGLWAVVRYYFLPWTIFATWLVITTFLHHHGTEDNLSLPWFANDQWSYVLGNLSSVDRDYGILHNVTHSIGTHQVHHLFPAIPHYHLKEATEQFRKQYPEFVRESKAPILQTFFNMSDAFRKQFIVSDDTKVFLYSNPVITAKKRD